MMTSAEKWPNHNAGFYAAWFLMILLSIITKLYISTLTHHPSFALVLILLADERKQHRQQPE